MADSRASTWLVAGVADGLLMPVRPLIEAGPAGITVVLGLPPGDNPGRLVLDWTRNGVPQKSLALPAPLPMADGGSLTVLALPGTQNPALAAVCELAVADRSRTLARSSFTVTPGAAALMEQAAPPAAGLLEVGRPSGLPGAGGVKRVEALLAGGAEGPVQTRSLRWSWNGHSIQGEVAGVSPKTVEAGRKAWIEARSGVLPAGNYRLSTGQGAGATSPTVLEFVLLPGVSSQAR